MDTAFRQAREWLAERDLQSADTMRDFVQKWGGWLDTVATPLGASDRADARCLFSHLYALVRAVGSIDAGEACLARAADMNALPNELAPTYIISLLGRRNLSADEREALVRTICRRGERREVLQRAEARISESWRGTVASDPKDAASELRVALCICDGAGAHVRAARQAAACLCALNRGETAAPYLLAAWEGDLWPDEWSPLLAYPWYGQARWHDLAALAQTWPSEAWTLGPAEPGARLRCGMALLHIGAIVEAEELLRPVYERFAWILSNTRWAAKEAGAKARLITRELPEAWLEAYWTAAEQLRQNAAGTAIRGLMTAVRETEASTSARRWSENLLRYQLGQELNSCRWEQAVQLLDQAPPWLEPGLRAWEEALVRLAGRGRPKWTPSVSAWEWVHRYDAAISVRVQSALLAFGMGASDLPERVVEMWQWLSPGAEQTEAVAWLTRFVVDGSDADGVRRLTRIGTGAAQAAVRGAVRRRLVRSFTSGAAATCPGGLGSEPVDADRLMHLLGRLVERDLAGLRAILDEEWPEGTPGDRWVRYLCLLCVKASLTQTAHPADEPRVEDLARVLGRGADDLPRGALELARAARLGVDYFWQLWAWLFEPERREQHRELLGLLWEDADLRPATAADVIQRLSLEWQVRGAAELAPFSGADLARWCDGAAL